MAKFPPVMKGANGLLYGGDYNPDQWLDMKDTIWKEDMEVAQKAGINTLSVGIFSWSMLEPEDGVYNFEWLDEVMDMLHANGIRAVLATPSGARPAWMAKKYPEVLRVNEQRQKCLFGERHNHCASSPVYREKVRQINTLLAERYKDHPALAMWHVSNEYGGECHCDNCQKRFRAFLKDRYGDIETLNQQWWNAFWAHRYTSFDEIESPAPQGDGTNLSLKLAWRRFCSWQTVDFYLHEIEPLKRITPDIPCTANLMHTYPVINYFDLGKVLDVSSWDNYPRWKGTMEDVHVAEDAAFRHDLMRGVCGRKPFMMMESCPGSVNWHEVNKARRPGTVMLQGLQAIAHGSDTVQYFQFRKGRGQYEKFHAAVIDHVGDRDTRAFREVAQVGQRLKDISCVAGTAPENEVAVVYDWENRWALDASAFGIKDDKQYERTVRQHHTALLRGGFGVDVIDQTIDLSPYKVVTAPMSYMLRGDFADRVREFVKNGGTFVMTYASGYVDEEDLCFLGGFPGPLRDVAGVWAEEGDVLYPGESNKFTYDGRSYNVHEWAELIHPDEDTKVLATFESDFYAGMPALTRHQFGEGTCLYVAGRTSESFLEAFYKKACAKAGVKPIMEQLPYGVGVTERIGDAGEKYVFLLSYLPVEEKVVLEKRYTDVETGESVTGEITLAPRQVRVFKAEE